MPIDKSSLPPHIIAALGRGDLIAVMKYLRDTDGLDLRQAKAAIDEYLRSGVSTPLQPATGFNPSAGLPPEVAALVKQGHQLEAIKLLRKQSGLDLKAAKEAVDRYAQSTLASGTGLAPGELARGRFPLWLIAVAIVVALLAYNFLSRSAA